jgi:hypothetical protein
MAISVSILHKNFLTKCRPQATKKCQIFTLGIGCMTFQGRCKNHQGRCKTISGEVRTSPHLPSKSGHGIQVIVVHVPPIQVPRHCLNTRVQRTREDLVDFFFLKIWKHLGRVFQFRSHCRQSFIQPCSNLYKQKNSRVSYDVTPSFETSKFSLYF